MSTPCSIRGCVCLCSTNSSTGRCLAHSGSYKATFNQPNPCPVCGKRIKKGDMMEWLDSGLPRHTGCFLK